MRNIRNLSSDGLIFEVNLYEVPNLITEDYDAGLGLVFDGRMVKPCYEPATFVLQSKAGVSLVKSNELRISFDEYFPNLSLTVSLPRQNTNRLTISGTDSRKNEWACSGTHIRPFHS